MRSRLFPGYIAAVGSGIAFGSIPVINALLRDINVSITEQTFLRLFLGGVISISVLFVYGIMKTDDFKVSMERKIQRTYFWHGLIFVLAIIVYVGSIFLETPVGEASFLVQIHPVVTLVFGFLFLNEKYFRLQPNLG